MTGYTNERNIQILIYLLKANGIRKIIISPGTTNLCFTASVQYDNFFQVYSCVDERSAAYMACGIAEQSGEMVVLSCTGATASRNYLSGLTEAYYRKLPVLAVTSASSRGKIGQLLPQVIDRYSQPNDVVNMSVQIPIIDSDEDEWMCNVLINEAILELRHRGGGPVHINIETRYNPKFDLTFIPPTRIIRRICDFDFEMPCINKRKVAIFIGVHKLFESEVVKTVERFCEIYNSIVIGDVTSNYNGRYWVNANISCAQEQYYGLCRKFDLLIHLGEISGAYLNITAKEVWRISEDGKVRDTFKTLSTVFEMCEIDFFKYYVKDKETTDLSLYYKCKEEEERIVSKIPELPFSNPYVARELFKAIPSGSIVHLAILNSLRACNFFQPHGDVRCFSNVGGFGIDGCVSAAIGASFVARDKLIYLVVGDLSFFYDMNALGNRHIGSNLRIILINNGKGTEFRNYFHPGSKFDNDADLYIAAGGHFGCQSRELVKHYIEDLGYKYLSASSKEVFEANLQKFLNPDISMKGKSIVFEIFTNSENESEALRIIKNTEISVLGGAKRLLKKFVKR